MQVNEAATAAKPKAGSRRMIAWLVVVPVVLLLLALAGANWKTFHLAYAKHLIASDDPKERARGIEMMVETHLPEGMPLEEVRRLLAPAEVAETDSYLPGPQSQPLRCYRVNVEDRYVFHFYFDENDRLLYPYPPFGK